MTIAADKLEAIRQLKARYCRFLDTKDLEGWRGVFTTGGVDPKMAPPLEGVDNFVPMVLGSMENAATMHPAIQESHTPEITLTSATTATGIWAMEDWIIFGDGHELHGSGHHPETKW
jgi:hypothetical protein